MELGGAMQQICDREEQQLARPKVGTIRLLNGL